MIHLNPNTTPLVDIGLRKLWVSEEGLRCLNFDEGIHISKLQEGCPQIRVEVGVLAVIATHSETLTIGDEGRSFFC